MGDGCEVGDRAVVDIETMAYGPHAIARHLGMVLFVRGAVPGERAEVVIRERRRNHAFADVRRIERRSPRRVQPACPVAGRCGGCPWQHLDYATQLEHKRRIVAEQLARIGGIEIDVPPLLRSERVYGYRRRIKLRVENGCVGFYAGGTHDLVQVGHCALAESELDVAIAAVQRLAAGLHSKLRRVELVATHRPGSGWVLAGEVEGRWRDRDDDYCVGWLDSHRECAGLTLRGKRWHRAWGELDIDLTPEDGVTLSVDGTGFTQVNPLANRVLVGLVVEMIGALEGRSVLDAYAGAGNFSATLARRGARVTAVEQSRPACRSAAGNADRFDAPWEIEEARVDQALGRFAAAGRRFDVLLLDPPRSGAKECVEHVLAIKPQTLVYVSCDPATLARDLAMLHPAYCVDRIQPVDMFPHTYHVETVVRCVLRE